MIIGQYGHFMRACSREIINVQGGGNLAKCTLGVERSEGGKICSVNLPLKGIHLLYRAGSINAENKLDS